MTYPACEATQVEAVTCSTSYPYHAMDLGPRSPIRPLAQLASGHLPAVLAAFVWAASPVAAAVAPAPHNCPLPQGVGPASQPSGLETFEFLRRPNAPQVAAAARLLLNSQDKELRSQAALAIAVLERGNARAATQARLLELSKSSEDTVRLRALVALGLAAAPGAEVRLHTVLEDHRSKANADAVAAAFGLGLLPPDHAGARVGKELSTLVRSGLGRRGPLVGALLAGLSRGAHPALVTSVNAVLETRARDHDGLRKAATSVLIHGDGVRLKDVEQALESNNIEDQDIAICALQHLPIATIEALSKPARATLRRLATRAAWDEVRGRALQILTRIRDPEALKVALRTLDSGTAIEDPGYAHLVEASIATVRQLGGGERARALETLGLTHKNITFAIRLLNGCAATTLAPTSGHAAEAARRVADAEEPLAFRIAAARFALAGGNKTVGDALPALFLASDDRATTEAVAQMMIPKGGWSTGPQSGMQDSGSSVTALLPQLGAADVVRTPMRLEALLRAGYPGAADHVAVRLNDAKVRDRDKSMLLVAWRRAAAPVVPAAAEASLSPLLRRVLAID